MTSCSHAAGLSNKSSGTYEPQGNRIKQRPLVQAKHTQSISQVNHGSIGIDQEQNKAYFRLNSSNPDPELLAARPIAIAVEATPTTKPTVGIRIKHVINAAKLATKQRCASLENSDLHDFSKAHRESCIIGSKAISISLNPMQKTMPIT